MLKKATIAILLAILACGSVMGGGGNLPEIDLEWRWSSDSEAPVEYYRYRFDDQSEWTVVDSSTESVVQENAATGRVHSIHIQSSYDGIHWSPTGTSSLYVTGLGETLTADAETTLGTAGLQEISLPAEEEPEPTKGYLTIGFSPLTWGMYDFFNNTSADAERAFSSAGPGMTIKAEAGWRFTSWFDISVNYSCSFLERDEIILPGDGATTHHGLSLGLGFTPFEFGPCDLGFSISGGVLASVYASYISFDPLVGIDLTLGWNISDHFRLAIGAGAGFSYQMDDDPSHRSMTYLVDALVVSAGVRF